MEKLTEDYQKEVRELSGTVLNGVQVKRRRNQELNGAGKLHLDRGVFYFFFSSWHAVACPSTVREFR